MPTSTWLCRPAEQKITKLGDPCPGRPRQALAGNSRHAFLRATAYDSLRLYKPAATNYKLFLAAAAGKFPDQEFQARHRLKAIEPN